MRLLPKRLTRGTKVGAAVVVALAILAMLGPGGGFAIVFFLFLSGPFSLLAMSPFFSGPGDYALIISMGIAGILMILSHSYFEKTWAVPITVFGYVYWVILGMAGTFSGV